MKTDKSIDDYTTEELLKLGYSQNDIKVMKGSVISVNTFEGGENQASETASSMGDDDSGKEESV